MGAAERLNSFLREGAARAMEEHVEAEVGSIGADDEDMPNGEGPMTRAETWKSVSAEYRDGLRMSDDLVRGLTGFLLGVGKVVRDVTASDGPNSYHNRSVSLPLPDDALSTGSGGSGGGRRSVLRGSLSPEVGTGGRRSVDSGGRLRIIGRDRDGAGSGGSRPGSAMNAAPSHVYGQTPITPAPPSRPTASTISSTSASSRAGRSTGSGGVGGSVTSATSAGSNPARRSLTMTSNERRELPLSPQDRYRDLPNERRELPMLKTRTPDIPASLESRDSLGGDEAYEPSPTPASRRQPVSAFGEGKMQAALVGTAPPPRATLRRTATHVGGNTTEHTRYSSNESGNESANDTPIATTPASSSIRKTHAHKLSSASTSTVRGVPGTGPAPVFSLASKADAPTTALTTHTVSTSPVQDTAAFPLMRTSSTISRASSVRSGSKFSGESGPGSKGSVSFAGSSKNNSSSSSLASSALNGVSQRDRESIRRRTTSGKDMDGPDTQVQTPARVATMSRTSQLAPKTSTTQLAPKSASPTTPGTQTRTAATRLSRRSLDGGTLLAVGPSASPRPSPGTVAGGVGLGSRRGLNGLGSPGTRGEGTATATVGRTSGEAVTGATGRSRERRRTITEIFS